MGVRTPLSPGGFNDSLRNLRRRRLYRVAAGYAVVAWLAVQIADVLFPVLFMPEWSVRLVLSVALLGFPLAIVLAWLVTEPRRGRLDAEVEAGARAPGRRAVLPTIIGVLAVVAGGLWLAGSLRGPTGPRILTSIAVLPFSDLSPAADNQYLGDGIAGELLSSLSRLEGLRVAARTSSFSFRGGADDVREIGAKLDVEAVVEGSLRRAGNELRINVQVIDARDGFNVWSRSYHRTLDDILSLQEEIAEAVVSALSLEVLGERPTRLARQPTDSAAAYRRYLEGRYEFHRRTPEALARAVASFEAALGEDPSFALAYTGLADAKLLLVSYGNLSPEQGRREAHSAISRALSLDDQLAEAYASLGLLRAHSGERLAAEQAYRHAIGLDPDYSMAQMWLGNLLQSQGRLRAARRAYRRAWELDPLHPVVSANLGSALMNAGDYTSGMRTFRNALEFAPDSDTLLREMSRWAGAYGRLADAVRYAEGAVVQAPAGPLNLLSLAQAWLWLGEPAAAAGWLERAEALAADNLMVFHGRALLYLESGRAAALGDVAERELRANPPADPGAYADRLRLMWAGIARVLLHDYDGGAELLEQALDSDEGRRSRADLPALAYLTMAYRRSAREPEAASVLLECREIIAAAREEGMDDPWLDVFGAVIAELEGQRDRSLDHLERAADRGWKRYGLIENHLAFDHLRNSPRFVALIRQMRRDVAEVRQALRVGSTVASEKRGVAATRPPPDLESTGKPEDVNRP